MNKLLAIAALTFTFGSAQAAPTLSYVLAVDDYAEIYLSTDDSQQGSFIASQSFSSYVAEVNNISLTPGVTNYIHIYLENYGGPDGLTGEFKLSGFGFEFANGTQFLGTSSTTVNLSATGFGVDYVAPGSNGPIIDAGSFYSDQYTQPLTTQMLSGFWGSVSYWSIPVYAVASVPEPENYALLLMGCGLILIASRVQQSKKV